MICYAEGEVISVQRRPFSKEEQDALQSLTSVERFLCGRLIARQFVFRPTIDRNIQKYWGVPLRPDT